ncbi:MAG: hypothetical protein ACRDH7_12840 [Actinomycetota bacterium]
MPTDKEFVKVRKEAERQGWRVEPTADGEMFFSPDGTTMAAWHTGHASSDPNALKAHIRNLKKGGFRWPPTKRR